MTELRIASIWLCTCRQGVVSITLQFVWAKFIHSKKVLMIKRHTIHNKAIYGAALHQQNNP